MPDRTGGAFRATADQVALIYGNFPAAAIGTAVNTVIIAWVLWPDVSQAALAVWVAVMYGVLGVRAGTWHLFRTRRDRLSADGWARWHAVTSAASGLALGVAGVWFYPESSFAHQAFLAVVMCGMTAGAALAYGAYLVSAMAYATGAVLPISAMFLIDGDPISNGIGMLGLMFLVVTYLFARQGSKALKRAIMTERENQFLRGHCHLFAELAHDFRTPLNTVIGYGDLLQQDDGDRGMRAATFGGEISAAGRQLRETLDDALALMKADAGRLRLSEQEVSLDQLVQVVVKGCAAVARDRGVVIENRMPGSLPMVAGDSRLLHQMVRSMIDHGIRRCTAGDHVTVIAEKTRRGRIILTVWYSGRKPDQAMIAGIMNPAAALRRRSSRTMEETVGLDLHLAQVLARLHGCDFLLAANDRAKGGRVQVIFGPERQVGH